MYNIHSLGFDLSIAEVNKRSLISTRRRASYARVNEAYVYKTASISHDSSNKKSFEGKKANKTA